MTPASYEGEREATEEIREGQLSPKFRNMDAIEEYLDNF